MWFQAVFAVVAFNSHWQWTENPLPLSSACFWPIVTGRDRIGR
jgi:hypothetical protein